MNQAQMPGSQDIASFERLVRRIEPDGTLCRVWELTGGVSARTTALEVMRPDRTIERFVVRAHGPRDVKRDPEIARHEFQLLEALWQAGLPVPRPIDILQPGEIFDGQAIVVEFVEGEMITASEMTDALIAQFGYWLARIHEFDLSANDLNFLVMNDYQAEDRLRVRPNDSQLVRSICKVLQNTSLVKRRNPNVLLHGDFWHGNLLWKDGKISAILDWEDAAVGDPIQDLARTRLEIFWTLGEHACERFTSDYVSHRDIDVQDLAYWDLVQALAFARALPEWGLPENRETEMYQALERFVEQAMVEIPRKARVADRG